MTPPRVFVASSSDDLLWAHQALDQLRPPEVEVVFWDQCFPLAQYTLDSVVGAIERSDYFLAFVHNPLLLSRPPVTPSVLGIAATNPETEEKKWLSLNQNVLFELGVAVGKLGRERCFLVLDAVMQDWRLGDLDGWTTLRLDQTKPQVGTDQQKTRERVMQVIHKEGVRT